MPRVNAHHAVPVENNRVPPRDVFETSPLAARVAREQEDRTRDLGFGTTVSRESRKRLLNRDGSFNVVRHGLGPLESLAVYHTLLAVSWPRFLGLAAGLYVVLNLAFGAAFYALGTSALLGAPAASFGGAFARPFFFSVETFATIGYGHVVPNGFGAHLLVTVEALVGMGYQALAIGLLFARFSRPTASLIFSRHAVVAPYGDGRALEFRIVNRRRNQIIQLEAQVLFSRLERDAAGQEIRRYHVLALERNKVTFFPLSWTIVHPIDETSPLASRSAGDLAREQAEILVLLSGVDETFEQTVHARTSYRADEIVWNARFRSMFLPVAADGTVAVDIRSLHDIEPA
jgi:inward rectifier potassium channel